MNTMNITKEDAIFKVKVERIYYKGNDKPMFEALSTILEQLEEGYSCSTVFEAIIGDYRSNPSISNRLEILYEEIKEG